MNLYFLVEGRRTERKVYRAWLGYTFPNLQEVDKIEDIKSNNFFMITGYGYPSYRQRIREALDNINQLGTIDHFFICIDTEEKSIDAKKEEIERIISEGQAFQNCHIILQNCCIETWFLGHQRMLKRNPTNEILRGFKKFYDVSVDDPENMEHPSDYEYRAHFHLEYLKAMLREQNLSYTKSNPRDVLKRHYFDALIKRTNKTNHIQTFGSLIKLWKALGGTIED
jgi:hypothetical protein